MKGIVAGYWKPAENGVICELCPHRCHIQEGKSGICRSRVCSEGKLWTTVYGRPCSIAIDPVEKKPLYHFKPGTECLSLACTGCNFRCLNCQNWEISQAGPEDVDSGDWTPEEIVSETVRRHLPSIAYTYTEPLTWWEYVHDISVKAHEAGLANILVSAGYVNPEPLKALAPLIDAANIDLKSLSDETYRKVSGGSLAPVLESLAILRDAGTELEITNLVIPGVNDSEEQLKALCSWLSGNGFAGCPLHFSRFFPRYRMQNAAPTPVSTLKLARSIAHAAGILNVHLGNVPEDE